jgi:xanthine permease XanP
LPSSAERDGAVTLTRPVGLLYSVDDSVPAGMLVLSALQHIGVIATTLFYPLILAREGGLDPHATLNYMSLCMLTLAVGTALLCLRSRFIGSGYLCPAGYTQIFLGPSLYALQTGGLAVMFGMTVIAGFLQAALAPALRRLRPLLPSEIAGVVTAIIGLSIATLGMRYILGIDSGREIRPDSVAIALVALATMIILNVWTKGLTRLFCTLIGTLFGCAASAVLGELDWSVVASSAGAAWVRVPDFQFPGWKFDAALLAPFAMVAIASTLQTLGNVSTAQRINDANWVRPSFRSLSGGVAANGIASMFGGMVGTPGVNVYTACVGLSSATGITSRSVGYAISVMLLVLATMPVAAGVFLAIPHPVIGALQLFLAAFVLTSGLQMITARMLDSRRTIVIGVSFAMAVMADIYRDAFTTLPPVLQPVFGNSLVLGTTCAVLLNLIMRIGVRKRESLILESGPLNREIVEKFLSEQGGRWAARREVINRATFGLVQVLELISGRPGGVEIEASFDEFSLELRVRHAGAPVALPEHRPSRREIIDSEEGERLLAGYLLRRSADRITSRAVGDRAEIQLHYDH